MLSISIENYQLHNITKTNIQFYNTFCNSTIYCCISTIIIILNEKCRYHSTYKNEYWKG